MTPVGSSDQRNTNWDTVGLEGDRHGTDGAFGLIRGPESGTLAAMEARAIIERDRSGPRQTRRINSWGGVLERRIHSAPSAAVAVGADLGGTRRDFSRPGHGVLDSADRRSAWASAVDHQSGN